MAKTVQIFNKKTQGLVSSECFVADNLWTRFCGLMGRDSIESHQSLLLKPCNSIHTFFMKFPIDVLFLDQDFKILSFGTYKPWRLSRPFFKAHMVLELPEGSLQKQKLQPGDQLEMRPPCIN